MGYRVKFLIFSLSLVISTTLISQDVVKWYTWEEGMEKSKEESKKFIVDLYTNWCGWCKKMDKATFQNPIIAEYINENYIPIKFNAEQKTEIEFEGKVHKFIRRGRGYHSLAALLANGRLSYPTVVFLSEDKKVIQALPGFLDAPTFDPIMRYFAEDIHKETPWAYYLRAYKSGETDGSKKNNHARLATQKKGN